MDRSGIFGKVCLVTGASAGIGEETAVALGQFGAHVLLACRDRRRGEAALHRVRRTGARCELFVADLSSQRQASRSSGVGAKSARKAALKVARQAAFGLRQSRSHASAFVILRRAVRNWGPNRKCLVDVVKLLPHRAFMAARG